MDEGTWVQVQAHSFALRHWKISFNLCDLSFLICEVGALVTQRWNMENIEVGFDPEN